MDRNRRIISGRSNMSSFLPPNTEGSKAKFSTLPVRCQFDFVCRVRHPKGRNGAGRGPEGGRKGSEWGPGKPKWGPGKPKWGPRKPDVKQRVSGIWSIQRAAPVTGKRLLARGCVYTRASARSRFPTPFEGACLCLRKCAGAGQRVLAQVLVCARPFVRPVLAQVRVRVRVRVLRVACCVLRKCARVACCVFVPACCASVLVCAFARVLRVLRVGGLKHLVTSRGA